MSTGFYTEFYRAACRVASCYCDACRFMVSQDCPFLRHDTGFSDFLKSGAVGAP